MKLISAPATGKNLNGYGFDSGSYPNIINANFVNKKKATNETTAYIIFPQVKSDLKCC
jgi:hypothetical protein